MGHRAGWLALGAGVSGGADAILIPEIPFSNEKLSESILERVSKGKRFSIVAVAEGAVSKESFKKISKAKEALKNANSENKLEAKMKLKDMEAKYQGNTLKISQDLQKLTGLESRVTILGHLQRGGTPSAADRLLATRLGTACIQYVKDEKFGIMVAAKGEGTEAVPLKDVVGKVKMVPIDHPWIISARHVGTSFGD